MLWLSFFLRLLPLSWSLAFGRGVAKLWYYVIPIRRQVARANIERIYGNTLTPAQKTRILKASFNHWCMYGIEMLLLPGLTKTLIQKRIKHENFDILDQAITRKKGVIVVTAHLGNFDLLGCAHAMLGYPLHVIFKDIHFAPARRFAKKVRDVSGIQAIEPRKSKEKIVKALQQGDIVAFTVDQHMAAHRAIVCTFFGQLAATSPAPVRFAFETGAAIIPAFMRRADQPGFHIASCEPVFVLETPYESLDANIRHNTERLNRIFEKWILTWPEQWLWQHRRFKVHDAPDGWSIPADLAELVHKKLKTENHR